MRGVTLIELLIVISLLGILTSVGMREGMREGIHEFEHAIARTDSLRVTAILRHARARAMHDRAESISWSEAAHAFLLKTGDASERQGLSPETGITISGTPLFLHAPGAGPESSIMLSAPGVPAWTIHLGGSGAIDTYHDL